ncbi:MAG: DUF2029 domain-containing protein [Alphaproteobacteria bacterium]|nr:DUF2029 domain-containing protein [Alphaproteobacteria bacterium]
MNSDQTTKVQRHRIVWLCLALAGLAMIGSYHYRGGWPFNKQGQVIQADAYSFWAVGTFTVEGRPAHAYDKPANDALVDATFGKRAMRSSLSFPYSPVILLFLWPLGLLTYPMAWIAFVGCGMLAWFSVLRTICKDNFSAAAATVAAGGATQSILFGQNGFYTASLFLAGLMVLPRNKGLAGLLFGLLTIKPHLGIALFAALIIWREWRAIFMTMLTVAGLAATATIAFGLQIWQAYLNGSAAFAGKMFSDLQPIIAYRMQSVFAMNVMKEDWKVGVALHATAAIGALIVMSRIKGRDQRVAAVVAASALVSPYIFHYDLTMLTGAAALLLRNSRRPLESGIIAIAAAIPVITVYIHLPTALLSAMPLLGIAYIQSVRAERPDLAQAIASTGSPRLAASDT